jgi:branched-chain amino acid transport system ATP-binding protein
MQVRDLCKSFGGHVVLNGVSLDLYEGQVVLLQGNNGSGKTTLLNILTGNLEPDSGSIWLDADGTEENFQFPFRWLQELNPFNHFTPEKVSSEAVGRTWQDVRLFQTRNLVDNIAVATPGQPGEKPLTVLMHNGTARHFERNNEQECRDLLGGIGLKDRGDSSADKISLGQTKRVAIVRAIRGGARILFLDEPLAGLDADGIEDVLALLASLAQQERVTLVIVEHVFNIPRILNLAQTVWTLSDGRIQVETAHGVSGKIALAFDSVVQNLLDNFSGPDRKVHEHLFHGGAKLLRIVGLAANPIPETPILDVRSLVVRRNGRLVVGTQPPEGSVHGLSFSLCRGDVAILCAPNGWGKTTMLEALSGVIPISQGQVLMRGMDAVRLPTWKRVQLGLRFIPARNKLFPSLSVADFLALSRQSMPQMDRFLSPDRLIGELSGGERQQLALTDLFVPGTLAILDEPFEGLDSASVSATGKRLSHFVNSLSGTLLIAVPATLNHYFSMLD